jgi:hypothetical protein
LTALGPGAINTAQSALTHQKTFSYTGKPQRFTVPKNVKELTLDALGAKGVQTVGLGARVLAAVPVTGGETLAVYVGGAGNGGSGGYNGGGGGGADSYVGAGGGGAGGGSSFVEWKALSHREWGGWKKATGNGVVVIRW